MMLSSAHRHLSLHIGCGSTVTGLKPKNGVDLDLNPRGG
jgi:hypothetical protein